MAFRDFHVHTTFSDGKNTPDEMTAAAIEKGMDAIGFSDHSFTAFDRAGCLPPQDTEYRCAVAATKERYAGQIAVRCGIERDYYSPVTGEYDYVIGSVHYVLAGGEYIDMDISADILRRGADRHFGGDIYALCEAYYQTVADVVRKTGADVIGHFDLITKFQEKTPLFDERHPRYVAAWRAAADELLKTGKPFEINTGAIFRGWRTAPYPAKEIREYIRAGGGRLILSGDAHSADALCYDFQKYAAEADDIML